MVSEKLLVGVLGGSRVGYHAGEDTRPLSTLLLCRCGKILGKFVQFGEILVGFGCEVDFE
jgi:hypothetical protein